MTLISGKTCFLVHDTLALACMFAYFLPSNHHSVLVHVLTALAVCLNNSSFSFLVCADGQRISSSFFAEEQFAAAAVLDDGRMRLRVV